MYTCKLFSIFPILNGTIAYMISDMSYLKSICSAFGWMMSYRIYTQARNLTTTLK